MGKHLAIYLRLSSEDINVRSNRLNDESDSIRNQRLLVEQYISGKPELAKYPTVEYSDDGYSGTNFDRPGVKRLLERVKTGEVACIVVKDLSRFGRNYLEVGDYLEHIFPLLGVRFIAVNDHYDSSKHIGSTGGIDVAFRNLIHQRYAQDLSEKIKSSRHMQMKKGKFVSHCPYGYMRHPTQKHQMVIDPNTAPIVREIFQSAISGKRTTEIAAMLNEKGVATPMAYKKWHKAHIQNDLMWSHQAVLRIIKDYKYTGAMVTFKCGNETVRARSQTRYKPEDWVIVEGCHEPIVSKEIYQKANDTIRKVKYNAPMRTDCKDRLYYCGCCGRRLRKTYGLDEYFSCQTPLYQKDAACATIQWSKSALEEILIQAYRMQLRLMEDELRKSIQRTTKDLLGECRRKQRPLSKELSTYEGSNLRLYESYRAGKLSREEFIQKKEGISNRQKELKTQLEELMQEEQRLMEESAQQEDQEQRSREMIQQLILSDDQIRPFMYEAVKRVDVYPSSDLEITWNFTDSKQKVN